MKESLTPVRKWLWISVAVTCLAFVAAMVLRWWMVGGWAMVVAFVLIIALIWSYARAAAGPRMVLPLLMFVAGTVILLGAAISASGNDIDQTTCELDQALGNVASYVDCTDQNGELAWFWIGGVLAVLGLLGFVVYSANRASRSDDRLSARPAVPPVGLGIADELKKLQDLLSAGTITSEEFASMKSRLLSQ